MHKEKLKIYKFFVVQDGGPAALAMPDIDNQGVLTIYCETIGRQVRSDDITDNSKRTTRAK